MKNVPTKVGIILTSLGGLDIRALKYLVLFQNTLQQSLEFEFLPTPEENKFIEELDSLELIDRQAVEQNAGKFLEDYHNWLSKNARDYDLTYERPDGFVILSTAKFSDNFYATGKDDWYLVALGHWQRHMAPPSIVEFFLMLLIRAAIDTACGDNLPLRHHATKGCIFDFTVYLCDVRLGVLTGFLCEYCCNTIKQSRSEKLVEDAKLLLRKQWLGDSTSPKDAAITAKKLGYDLFHTKGVRQTRLERLSVIIEKEAIRNVFMIVAVIILSAILIWFGLKAK